MNRTENETMLARIFPFAEEAEISSSELTPDEQMRRTEAISLYDVLSVYALEQNNAVSFGQYAFTGLTVPLNAGVCTLMPPNFEEDEWTYHVHVTLPIPAELHPVDVADSLEVRNVRSSLVQHDNYTDELALDRLSAFSTPDSYRQKTAPISEMRLLIPWLSDENENVQYHNHKGSGHGGAGDTLYLMPDLWIAADVSPEEEIVSFKWLASPTLYPPLAGRETFTKRMSAFGRGVETVRSIVGQRKSSVEPSNVISLV